MSTTDATDVSVTGQDSEQRPELPLTGSEPGTRMKIGEDLYVVVVKASALKEQDINAQQMDPTKFERLVENIRQRGGMESLPYVHQPGGEGPMSIISGHHRAKAARIAGLSSFPVLVDQKDMPRSLIRAKQIAHNELTGEPDTEILRQMIDEIDDVEHLLMTGLDEEYLPEIEPSGVSLSLPHADFDWRMVTLMFLPEQKSRFDELVTMVASGNDLIGAARFDQFDAFSKAMVEYGQVAAIKNMATVIDVLTNIAQREIAAAAKQAEEDAAAAAVAEQEDPA